MISEATSCHGQRGAHTLSLSRSLSVSLSLFLTHTCTHTHWPWATSSLKLRNFRWIIDGHILMKPCYGQNVCCRWPRHLFSFLSWRGLFHWSCPLLNVNCLTAPGAPINKYWGRVQQWGTVLLAGVDVGNPGAGGCGYLQDSVFSHPSSAINKTPHLQ